MRAAALALAVVALAALASGCEPALDDPVAQVQGRLVGTWLRDYEQDGTRVRRILVLEADGRFREMSRTLGPQEAGGEHRHEGQWHYDGTNLKRRYTLVDGKQPAAPMVPFATFELRLRGSHEFTGRDNVRGRELRYRRVQDGTLP